MSDFAAPWTIALQAPLSMGILQARILEWVAISFSRGFSRPWIKSGSPVLQADSLLSEPPGKPTISYFLPYFFSSERVPKTVIFKMALEEWGSTLATYQNHIEVFFLKNYLFQCPIPGVKFNCSQGVLGTVCFNVPLVIPVSTLGWKLLDQL